MRRVVRLVSWVMLLSLPCALGEGWPRYRVRVEVDRATHDRIVAAGLDLANCEGGPGELEILADAQELTWLQQLRVPLQLLEVRQAPRSLLATEQAESRVPLADSRYTDPAEMESFLQQVAADHPQITHLESIGTTIQGRDIWAMRISDNAATDEDELAVLFSGAHHAREVMTPEATIDLIDYLTDRYGGDAQVTELVDALEVWVVPIVNPDGVNVVHTADDFWRKNVRDNDGSGGLNGQDGVDLNRNYEWGWGGQCGGSSSSFSSQTYRGPSEASEPETRAMVGLGRRILPVFDVEWHTHGEDVFYALSCDPTQNPSLSTIGGDGSISRIVAEDYGARIVQADGQVGYNVASYGSRVDGTGRDQQYRESGAIGFVVEMNNSAEGGFHPDYGLYRDATVEGQRPGWLWLLERVQGPAVGGRVTDAVTDQPLVASYDLDELSLPDGRTQWSRPNGRFHQIVVPGSYTLRVAAPGYESATLPVVVGTDWVPTDVSLVPTSATLLLSESFEEAATASQWTAGDAGDDATTGLWVWAEPHGTHSGSIPSVAFGNARFDATPGAGSRAWVTGNAPGFDVSSDDVDGGTTTLLSPSFDLSGFYGVELTYQRWFASFSIDSFELAVSIDGGQGWLLVESLDASTSTPDATPAWAAATHRLDDLVPVGADTRFRVRVTDGADPSIVEAGVDDFELRGYALAEQGTISDLTISGDAADWSAVPGGEGATYDVVRGDLASLSGAGGTIELGPLVCIENDSNDSAASDPQLPSPGEGFFYLARFELGFSVGPYGVGSDSSPRVGQGGCSP